MEDSSGMTEWNKACLACRLVHSPCNGERPCKRCLGLGRPGQCVNVERKKRGRPRKTPIEGEELLEKRARLGAQGGQPVTADTGPAEASASPPTLAASTAASAPVPTTMAADTRERPAAPHPTFLSQLLSTSSAASGCHSSSSSPSNSPPLSPRETTSSSSSSSPSDHFANTMMPVTSRFSHESQCISKSRAPSGKRTRRNDHQRASSDMDRLIKEMKELRKENRSLNEKLAQFCDKVDRRLSSSEQKIDSLSASFTATSPDTALAPPSGFVSSWSSLASSISSSSPHIRREILKDLPFLLDYDILYPSVPFLIDDLRKPFIVRRIFDPTPEEELTVPVTIYANPSCCALLATQLHEIVGAPCWFALEQPIRTYLTARSHKPVGDIFLNAVTRKGFDKRLLRLFSRNQVFYNSKGNAKWWISIIDQQEELPAASSKDCNKLALIINRNRRGGATVSLLPKNPGLDAEEDEETSRALTSSSSPSSVDSSPATATYTTTTTVATPSLEVNPAAVLDPASSRSPKSSSTSGTLTNPPFPSSMSYYLPPSTLASPFFPQPGGTPSVQAASLSTLLYTSGLPSLLTGSVPRTEGPQNLGLVNGTGLELGDASLGSLSVNSPMGGSLIRSSSSNAYGTDQLDQELQDLWAILDPDPRDAAS